MMAHRQVRRVGSWAPTISEAPAATNVEAPDEA